MAAPLRRINRRAIARFALGLWRWRAFYFNVRFDAAAASKRIHSGRPLAVFYRCRF
jgi:hypothetical protein